MTQANAHHPHAAPVSSGSRHLSGVSLNGPLAISLVALALVGLAVAVGFAGVVSSVFRGSVHEDQPKAVIDDLVVKHDQKADEYANRFNERYIFYKPPPPPPPPRRPEPERPAPPPPPVDTGPKIPATYQGPSIVWVIGEDVYFSMIVPTQTEKYMRVRVGEERNGVKVLSTENVPRTVRVAHGGGEYDVKVFGDVMSSNTLFPTSPRPSITVPGFIPAGQQGAPMPADSDATSSASADAEAAAAAAEANGIETQTADGQERRSPGRGRRGNGERQRNESGDRPDGGNQSETQASSAPRPG